MAKKSIYVCFFFHDYYFVVVVSGNFFLKHGSVASCTAAYVASITALRMWEHHASHKAHAQNLFTCTVCDTWHWYVRNAATDAAYAVLKLANVTIKQLWNTYTKVCVCVYEAVWLWSLSYFAYVLHDWHVCICLAFLHFCLTWLISSACVMVTKTLLTG